MERNYKITYFLDIVMTSIISLLILYTAQTIGFTILFIVVPSIVIFLKYGMKEFVATEAIIASASVFFMNWQSIILVLAIIITLTLIISNMLKSNENIYKIIVFSSIAFTLLIAIYIMIFTYFYNINLGSLIKSIQEQVTISLKKIVNEDIKMDVTKIEGYIVNARELVRYSISIFPSLILVSGFIFSTTNTFTSVNLFNKTEEKSSIKINRSGINLKNTVRKTVLAMTVFYFIIIMSNLSNSYVIENNISFLILFILFVNGVIISYKFSKNKIGRLAFILLLVPFIVLLDGYTILAIFGMLDLFFNLSNLIPIRKRK